jgi:hypothetical protein
MAESFSAKPPAPSAWTKGRQVDPSQPCRHLPDSDEASSEFAPLLFFSGPGLFCPSLPIHGMDGPPNYARLGEVSMELLWGKNILSIGGINHMRN